MIRVRRALTGALLCLLLATTVAALATELKPIEIPPDYQHERWGTQPRDIVREFRAYTVSFDSQDDNDGDGAGEAWGIPEWVAYEIKQHPDPPRKGPERPRPWITDEGLHEQEIAPDDASYTGSTYDRGHMCQKLIAFRLGLSADWNTHTVLNACPQEPDLNRGIWLDLEKKTAEWADEHGAVWVVCGPVFLGRKPRHWIGDEGEVPVAVLDAFFKVVVKGSADPDHPDVPAFLYPHHRYRKGGPYDHKPFLVSVNYIEALTGLDFLTVLPDDAEDAVESVVATDLW